MKNFFSYLLILMLLPFFIQVTAAAEGNMIFTIEDPVNDDYGPGTYSYPTHEIFQGDGLFDITNFSIYDEDSDYLLSFEFSRLTDPWQSKFNFSLPLIQLYIDNQKGGSTQLFKEGANVKLDPGHPWNVLLKISGWWVRVFSPDDRNQEIDFWDVEENPWDVNEARLEVKNNNILLWIDKELIGPLENSYIYLLVGSFDPFGPDYFRTIDREESSWTFTDSGHENLGKAPRVLDILLPPGLDQTRVLSSFDDDYPLIYPLKIKDSGAINYFYTPYLSLIMVIIIFLVMNKKKFFRDNKD